MNILKAIMLVGLPASGKSTFSKNFSTEQVFSSDQIREDLFGDANCQDNPVLVFNTLYQRMRNYICSTVKNTTTDNRTITVVFDATNLKRNNRKRFIKEIKEVANQCNLIPNCSCFVFNTPVEICLIRNRQRDRIVPDDVIVNMNKNFQFPTKDEGFSEIFTICTQSFNK